MRRSSTSHSGCVVPVSISASMTRIEDVAQTVAEQVERETDQQDRKPGNGCHPPGVEQHVAAGRNHITPLRTWRLRAESEKAEARDGENDAGHIERRAHDHR